MNFRKPNEDLFENTRMSFGQHLEELRSVLLKCLVAIAIGCMIGFLFASQTVEYLKVPLVEAMADFNSAEAVEEITANKGYVAPEMLPWLEREKLIPRRLKVDPGQLIEALQTVIPDFGTKVQLNPYGFRAKDIQSTRLPELCGHMIPEKSTAGIEQERVSEIWERLSASEQADVNRIAQLKVDVTQPDVQTIATIFDQLTRQTDLNGAEAFADQLAGKAVGWLDWLESPEVNPLAEMKKSLDQKPDAEASQRLNRALLHNMFAPYLNELKMDLVTIEMWERADFEPQSLTVTEPFMIWMKAGLISGVIIALPVVMYFLWSFVAAGLYPHEQKYVHIFLPISIGLFIAGVTLAFFFVFEPVLGFLFSFNRQMGIAPQLRINDWLSFVMFLPLGFGLAFQLPLVMLFMNRINLFQVEDYLSKWRIAVMCIFVASMILTPADPISMLLLALPLTLLYFLGVAMCQWMPRNKNPFEEERSYTTDS